MFIKIQKRASTKGALFPCKVHKLRETPAFIQGQCACVMLLGSMDELPKHPQYRKIKQFRGDPVVSGGTSIDFYEPLNDSRSFEEIEREIRESRKIFFVSGYIQYNDIFGRNHETHFGLCYRAAEECKIDYDGFFVDGPKRYNIYS